MKILYALLLFLAVISHAHSFDFALGSSQSSAMAGRTSPGFYVGMGGDAFYVSVNGSSVYNDYYGHAIYQYGFFWQRKKEFLGTINWGLGFGGTFSYREATFNDQATEEKDDWTFGPATHVSWNFLGPLFFGFEVVLGLRDPWAHAFFSFQESATMFLGLRF